MQNNGWIKLHRKLLENPLIGKPNYLTLWIALLLKANHRENKIMWNGEVLIVKEGQILTGRKELSQLTNIPETTIERALTYLEKSGHQIGQQKTTKFRLITVINWKEYQKENIKTDNKRTTNGQQTDTNNNDKKTNNDNNNPLQAEPAENINPLIKEFEIINPTINYGNTTQRNALKEMIKKFGYDKLLATIKFAVSIQGKPYSPVITTPCQLKENMGKLLVYYEREKNNKSKITIL